MILPITLVFSLGKRVQLFKKTQVKKLVESIDWQKHNFQLYYEAGERKTWRPRKLKFYLINHLFLICWGQRNTVLCYYFFLF